VVIEKSEVENSIIMEGCKIEGIGQRISESILGKEVLMISRADAPSLDKLGTRPERLYHQFIIGDKSEIILA
jgi:NDP-sugar pyrophosphorylase family protein